MTTRPRLTVQIDSAPYEHLTLISDRCEYTKIQIVNFLIEQAPIEETIVAMRKAGLKRTPRGRRKESKFADQG